MGLCQLFGKVQKEMIFCSYCKTEKSQEDFYKDYRRKAGIRIECKQCTKRKYIEFKTKYPEIYKAHVKRSNRKHARSNHLKYTYGITKDQYNSLLQLQNELCAICQQKETIHKYLLVDHDHLTNKIRGLLCSNCNVALGRFKYNTEVIMMAIKYLKGPYATF